MYVCMYVLNKKKKTLKLINKNKINNDKKHTTKFLNL